MHRDAVISTRARARAEGDTAALDPNTSTQKTARSVPNAATVKNQYTNERKRTPKKSPTRLYMFAVLQITPPPQEGLVAEELHDRP